MSETAGHRRLWMRRAAICCLLLVVAGCAAPFTQANRYRNTISRSLERALHRHVEIGEVRLNLFTGPGFSLTDVEIAEDPAFGIEPFAYVASLNARIRLYSLLSGKLEFSTLTLYEPSVNLVKLPGGGWNLLPLLERRGSPAGQNSGSSLLSAIPGIPAIQIRGGRLDFKFGDHKSSYYFLNPDLDIWPSSDASGSFDLRMQGELARTDRTAQGFGTLSGRGRLTRSAVREPQLDVSLALQPTAVEEMTMFLDGRDLGLHGLVSSQASISGPISNLKVAGNLRVADIHRWDLMPNGGSSAWRMNYAGTIDWPRQRLELATVQPATGAKKSPPGPISLDVRVFDYLTEPKWAASVTIRELPAASLVETARHMGAKIPKNARVDGRVIGVIAYSSQHGLQGSIALQGASLEVPGASRVEIPEAQLIVDGPALRLLPCRVIGGQGQSADFEGEYEPGSQSLDFQIRGNDLDVAELQAGAGHLLSTATLPFVERLSAGRWTGDLRYREALYVPGRWTGSFELRDAETVFDGLSEPLELKEAKVELDTDRLEITKLRGNVGPAQFEGQYSYLPGDERPHRFRLSMASLELSEVEQLLKPLLQREDAFFLRTLRLRRSKPPAWLEYMNAEGTLRIGALSAPQLGLEVRDLRSWLTWDSSSLALTNIEAKVEDGNWSGRMHVDVSGVQPKYRLAGRLRDLSWRGGKVDIETKLESYGTGSSLLANLKSAGNFQAHNIALMPDSAFRNASGDYEASFGGAVPQIKLSSVQASMGLEKFTGQGQTSPDGKLQLDLTSGTRTMRATGPLLPFRLDITMLRPLPN